MTDEISAAPAGWYPDPEMAHTKRYWDGAQWTDHRAPDSALATEPQAPSSQSSGVAAWKRVSLIAAAIVVAAVVWQTSSIGDMVPSTSAGDDLAGMEAAEYDCADLASDAVSISAENSNGFQSELLKVRSPRVVEDNRSTYELPRGNGESLVLACEGVGVWDDMEKTRVRLEQTIDSDGDSWVSYEAIY